MSTGKFNCYYIDRCGNAFAKLEDALSTGLSQETDLEYVIEHAALLECQRELSSVKILRDRNIGTINRLESENESLKRENEQLKATIQNYNDYEGQQCP